MRASLLVAALLCLPALAMAATWTNSGFSQSVIMGVSAPDSETIFAVGGDNGVGANVLKSTDGGKSWNSVQITPTLMLLAIAAGSTTEALVSGIGILGSGSQYLTNGVFKNSSMPGVSMQQTQDAQPVCTGSDGQWNVATTGIFEFFDGSTVNGVAISSDAGATFEYSNTTLDANANPARYSSFPGCQTGFISAGSWPPNSFTGKKNVKEISRNVHIHYADDGAAKLHFTELDRAYNQDAGWSAAIAYSGDSDSSWKQVFNATNFYFNQISCPSKTVCYAAGENDDDGFIYGTKDGGKTWQLQFTAKGTSLMAAQALSEKEAFIAGGVLGAMGITGSFYHTTDGGQTWDLTSVPGYYFMDLSMVSSTKGFAAAMDDMSQSDVLIYA